MAMTETDAKDAGLLETTEMVTEEITAATADSEEGTEETGEMEVATPDIVQIGKEKFRARITRTLSTINFFFHAYLIVIYEN